MEEQLVLPTWGLVVATALLFLAALVPAVGQFRDWRERKAVLAADLIPRVTAIRSHAEELRDELLRLDGSEEPEEFAQLYFAGEAGTERLNDLSDAPGLTIEQRLHAYVMTSHVHLGMLLLSLLGNEEEELRGDAVVRADRVRRARIAFQAAIGACDEFEGSLLEVRRRFGGRTFTQEMMRRGELGLDRAEKDLVDLRRESVAHRSSKA